LGYQAVDPFKLTEKRAMLAILDGQDVDSGTAAEIGYAFARRKPIVYRGDLRVALVYFLLISPSNFWI
jgi:nucleoside 2-deoxyribosyltransferase